MSLLVRCAQQPQGLFSTRSSICHEILVSKDCQQDLPGARIVINNQHFHLIAVLNYLYRLDLR